MVYAQPRICPGEWDAQFPQGFWDTNKSPNLGQKIRPYNNQQKRENLQNCRLCCPGWPQTTTVRKQNKGFVLGAC